VAGCKPAHRFASCGSPVVPLKRFAVCLALLLPRCVLSQSVEPALGRQPENSAGPQAAAPASQQQPPHIAGVMPNFRAVTAGTRPPPPSPKEAFKIATKDSFDYSAFAFVGINLGAGRVVQRASPVRRRMGGLWPILLAGLSGQGRWKLPGSLCVSDPPASG